MKRESIYPILEMHSIMTTQLIVNFVLLANFQTAFDLNVTDALLDIPLITVEASPIAQRVHKAGTGFLLQTVILTLAQIVRQGSIMMKNMP